MAWRSLHHPVWQPHHSPLRCFPTDLPGHGACWLSMPCSCTLMHHHHTYKMGVTSTEMLCPPPYHPLWHREQGFPRCGKSPVCHHLHYEAIWASQPYSGGPCYLPPLLRYSCADRGKVRRMQELHDEGRRCFDPYKFHLKLRNWIGVQAPVAFFQLFLSYSLLNKVIHTCSSLGSPRTPPAQKLSQNACLPLPWHLLCPTAPFLWCETRTLVWGLDFFEGSS